MADLTIHCPHCDKRYRIADSQLGRRARCQWCTKSFQLVTTSASQQDEPNDDAYRQQREAGLRLLKQGDLTKAIAALGQAVRLRPDLAEAHLHMGKAFREAGKFEAARQAYKRAKKEKAPPDIVAAALAELPPPPPTRLDFAVGDIVQSSTTPSRYRIEQALRGGFGSVYLVTELESNQRYALKTYQSKFLWSDNDRRRFEREALTWMQLGRHPHIVRAEVIIHIEGFPCLELEFMPGGDLAALLEREGPLPPRRALELAFQFCDGMQFAFEKLNLVHRDVKPSNCLLDAEGNLKIADFGLSRSFAEAEVDRLNLAGLHPELASQYTTVGGTPRYMAPEQWRAGARLDARTDIYAFAIMLYLMLTGDLPPSGQAARQHIEDRRGQYAAPSGLFDLLLRCVEPHPEQRPANFRELRTLLAAIYRQLVQHEAPPVAQPEAMTKADWKNQGIALGSLQRYEEEIACYQQALQLAPDDSELWQNQGVAQRLLGRIDKAIACYDRGLKLTPDSKSLWMNKGVALGDQGRFVEEIACYDRALQIAPQDSHLWKNKGVALGELERYEEELACYDQALHYAPRDSELWQNKGVTLRLLGRTLEALTCYEEGLKIAPRDSRLWQNRGVALSALKRHQEAVACYERALEIAPRDPGLWMNKGAAYGELGRHLEELACYERGLQLEPNHGDLWNNKGFVLRELGRTREADDCFRKATQFRR